MRTFCLVITLALLTVAASPLHAQTAGHRIAVEKLRADVAQDILNEQDFDLLPLVNHLWRSNGGGRIPRNPRNPAAQALATEIAAAIAFDPESATLSWPVYGFTGPANTRFPSNSLWTLFGLHFARENFDPEYLRTVEQNFLKAAESRPALPDPVMAPPGLTMPAERLLHVTGYYGSWTFVYSPTNSFSLALKCFQLGLFDDALVLLSHAIALQEDPRYYFVRGTIEMMIGRSEDAKISARGFIATMSGPNVPTDYVYERVNGPASIQFRALVAELRRRGTF